MKPPEIVNATQAELDELLAKAKPTFSAEQYLLLGVPPARLLEFS